MDLRDTYSLPDLPWTAERRAADIAAFYASQLELPLVAKPGYTPKTYTTERLTVAGIDYLVPVRLVPLLRFVESLAHVGRAIPNEFRAPESETREPDRDER